MPPEDRLYRPFGGVSPTKAQTPALNISTPRVDFSQSIGRALEDVGERVYRTLGNSQIQVGAALAHMGDTFEHVGDELFNRARAIKHVENETKAVEAETKFRIDADQRTDAFRDQTKASGAVGSLEAHMKGLEDSRQQIRATLPNDEARNMYDQHSLRALGHQMARAGDHAATQGKAASLAAAENQLKLDLVEIEKDPTRADAETMKQRALENYDQKVAPLQGDTGPTREYKKLQIVSSYNQAVIKGVARTNPIEANRMLEDYRSKGQITPEHATAVEATIQTKQTTIGASNISGQVTADMDKLKTPKDWSETKGKAERIAEARAEAEKDPILGKNPEYVDYVGRATGSKFDAKWNQFVESQRRARMSIEGVILGMKSPDGKTRPKDMAEARAMGGDEFDANFAMLPYNEQNKYRGIIESGDHLDNEQIRDEHTYWQGLASSSDTVNQQKVLAEDFMSKPWPWDRKKDMFNRQNRILQGEGKSVHLKHAETVTDPVLPKDFKRDDEDGYYRWKGFLENFILQWQGTFHTMPDDKVLIDAAKRYGVKQAKEHWWNRARFPFDPTPDAIESWKTLHPGQGEREAREAIAGKLVKDLYQSFYSKGGVPAPLPGEPAVSKWIREHGPTQ